jgi:NADH-quinone oxidoreductase subunit F
VPVVPVLSAHWDDEDSFTLEGYRRHGGYDTVAPTLARHPDEIIQVIKDSGLRGRGGAGFPTGMKWGFVPQGDAKPHYLVVNADESEPGACKDVPILLANPHALIEGMIAASYAIRAHHAFIYIRGEVPQVLRRVYSAVAEARAAGYLGADIQGSGYDLEITVHAGAGAYICGEETALLDSLEGYRGQPRLKPPFPAVAGLYSSPTVVNNVETIASVPSILTRGPEWFRSMGTEKSPGFKMFAVSGHVAKPGVFEMALGCTLRELLELAGGVRDGHELKFWLPGGSSVPWLTADHLDTPLTYEDMNDVGTFLGTATVMVFDDSTSVVRAATRWVEFYKHESCGKCTPCREGGYWLVELMRRFERGEGSMADMATLEEVGNNMIGRSFCALGDSAPVPIQSAVKYFRDEFLQGLTTPASTLFDPVTSTVYAGAHA